MVELLEKRTYLATNSIVGADGASDQATGNPGAVVVPMAVVTNPAADVLTLADRREILQNWIGPIGRKLTRLLDAGEISAFDYRLMEYMQTRAGPAFYWKTSDLAAYEDFAKAELRQQVESTVSLADQNLSGYFPEETTSGTYTIELESAVDWTKQPSGVSNPEFLYSLNRQGFWVNLAMAARFTGEAKYAEEIARQLASWASQIKPLSDPSAWSKTGATWDLFSTALRVDNWLWSYFMVLGTSGWTPETNTLFLHRLMKQADFLHRAPGLSVASNKTVGHARALLTTGVVFPEFSGAKAWASAGRGLVAASLAANFRGDGGHVEQSPEYHRGVIEDMLEPYWIDKLNGVEWSEQSLDLLVNGAEAFYNLLSPDGTTPMLSDSHRVAGLRTVSRLALTLGEGAWPVARPTLHDVFMLGPEELGQAVNASNTPTLTGRATSYALPDSGYYVMRSGTNRAARQMVFDAGPKGGTHGHYDLLNFELFGLGRPLITDPGAFVYDDSAQRRWAVSTPAHNTISIDGANHAAIESSIDGRISLDYWHAATYSLEVAAHHSGYGGMKGSPVVGRSISFDRDDTFVVVDWGQASYTHTYTSSFTLATPADQVSRFRRGMIRTTSGRGDVMIQPLLLDGQTIAITDAASTPEASPAEPEAGVRFTVSQRGRSALIANLIVTYTGSEPPSVEAKWLRYPTATRSGRIEVIRDGVSSLVYVSMPAQGAAKAAAAPMAMTARTAAFAVINRMALWNAPEDSGLLA